MKIKTAFITPNKDTLNVLQLNNKVGGYTTYVCHFQKKKINNTVNVH